MTTPLLDRLREASIDLPAGRAEGLGAAIERVAGARTSLPELLGRVRIAHRLEVSAAQRDVFASQLNREDPELIGPGRNDQLLAVLAACILIARFDRTEGARASVTLRALAATALAVRALSRSGWPPAHPDLLSWAGHWQAVNGEQVRQAAAGPPPRPQVPPASPQGAEAAGAAVQIEALREHLGALGEWFDRSGGASAIPAIREQTQGLWWLAAAERTGDPADAAVEAAFRLADIGLIPPPPSAAELLKRRLGALATAEVLPESFEERRRQGLIVPRFQGSEDLTPLLTRGPRGPMSASELAHGIFEEVVLGRVVGEFEAQARVLAEQAKAKKEEQPTTQAGQ
jgi:hypothetical protein